MKILFSPIGSTDPISNNHDGGMLHICRLYHPDKIYLYLSKEMLIFHDKDDRYCQAVRLLYEEQGWEMAHIEIIRAEDMEDVQLFDPFVDLFEKELNTIRETDKPEMIYVNISSGTPAMKASLQILSFLYNDLEAIQVSTPEKASNKIHENKDTYDLSLQWEMNEDREPEFENRCVISHAKRLFDRIKKETIRKHIAAYDYEAAKVMAESLSEQPSQEFMELLDIAIARQKLNLKFVNAKRKDYALDKWFPIVEERKMKEFEYLLAMEVKLKRKQYVDFVRDITPIFFSLSERVLEKYCELKFDHICYKDKQDVYRISLEKAQQHKIRKGEKWGEASPISSYIILDIMKQLLPGNQDILPLMEKIRCAESKVRNLAAHEIVGVTETWIENHCHYSSADIMEMLFEMARLSDLLVSGKCRGAYEIMNRDLIAKML